ncbi:MAG: MFS transporter [Acidobacteria bacterium]|nr:MFS transporter [Acidobacteriota bacterium]
MATPQLSLEVQVSARPTRVRYWVIVFAVTLAVVTYIDRVCISQAGPSIARDLGLSAITMGYVYSAFAWGYALFEIPGGYWGDRVGVRRVLMRVVIWWSFFTAATGWVWNSLSLIVTRFLFGAGEAGCFPNLTKAFTIWLPREERERAQGILWMSARWGGAFTPLLVYQVLQYVSWRRAFEIFGAVGIVWAIVFYYWYRDNPRDNPKLNAAERALLPDADDVTLSEGHVPWARFLRSGQVWLLCAQYFCLAYGWSFYITWMPTYLREGRGLEMGQSAWLSILPLGLGGLGSLFCGFASARVTRWTGSVKITRRIMAVTGFACASLLLALSTWLQDPLWAMLVIGFASFANDLVMPGSWGACMDMGGKYAGTLSGAMNMFSSIGGALSPIVIGYLLAWTGENWDLTFYVSAAVYFMGAFCWLFLDSVTPIERE